MTEIDFFKLQAKNFLRDLNNREFDGEIYSHTNAGFYKDIDEIIVSFDIDEFNAFSLMNSQHIVAKLAGFDKWSNLINSDKDGLILGKLLFEHRNDYIDGYALYDHWMGYLQHNGLENLDNGSKLQIFKMIYNIK